MLRLTRMLPREEATDAPEAGERPERAGANPGAALEKAVPTRALTLTFAERRRSRLLCRLDGGEEVALMLPRGTALRDGDRLSDQEGRVMVRVRAADETLSVARTTDPLLLSRGAYHLGNRHIPVQLGPGWLAYEHDHVLDDLARGLGLTVTSERAAFEPEAGGYRHGGHRDHLHAHDGDGQDRPATSAPTPEHPPHERHGHRHPHD